MAFTVTTISISIIKVVLSYVPIRDGMATSVPAVEGLSTCGPLGRFLQTTVTVHGRVQAHVEGRSVTVPLTSIYVALDAHSMADETEGQGRGANEAVSQIHVAAPTLGLLSRTVTASSLSQRIFGLRARTNKEESSIEEKK